MGCIRHFSKSLMLPFFPVRATLCLCFQMSAVVLKQLVNLLISQSSVNQYFIIILIILITYQAEMSIVIFAGSTLIKKKINSTH